MLPLHLGRSAHPIYIRARGRQIKSTRFAIPPKCVQQTLETPASPRGCWLLDVSVLRPPESRITPSSLLGFPLLCRSRCPSPLCHRMVTKPSPVGNTPVTLCDGVGRTVINLQQSTRG